MKQISSVILILLIALFAYLGYNYIAYRTQNAVSNAGFIRSDSLLTLGFKVGGKVVELTKREGDRVEKGELLARIDSSDFEIALNALRKKVLALLQKEKALDIKHSTLDKELTIQLNINQIQKSKTAKEIEGFKYEIKANEVKLQKLRKDLKRFEALALKKVVQLEKLERVKSEYESLKNLILAQKSKLKSLNIALELFKQKQALLETKKEGLKELKEQILALQKEREGLIQKGKEIEKKIEYCSLYSPIKGKIAKRFISLERVVKAGYPIYSVVDPNDLHLEVYLSERKLEGVEVGNRVKIEIDAFKDRTYQGVVEKISPVSASTFALVPRDISSGEFTKLDQRFIIRISLENPTPNLLVGMGASVAIERRKE